MVTLRNFSKADVPFLQQNVYSSLSAEQVERLIAEWETKQVNGNYFEMFAILHNSVIVGTVSLYQRTGEAISIGPEIWEEYRQKGFAKSAMQLACDLARSKGFKIVSQQIRTDNSASIALHTSLGFASDGYVYTNAKGNRILIYLKSLV